MGFCLGIYIVVAFVGIYSYGDFLQGDIFVNIGEVQSWESYVLRGFFLIVISTHTPFIIFIGKESLLTIIAQIMIVKESEEEMSQNGSVLVE